LTASINLGLPTLRRGLAFVIAALFVCATAYGDGSATPAPPAPGSELDALDLEQLMKIEVVFAASKREQHVRAVPSFVSVVTAAEIKAHGYRTLADVLKTLPSFYVANDRNYTFLGVRGFSVPVTTTRGSSSCRTGFGRTTTSTTRPTLAKNSSWTWTLSTASKSSAGRARPSTGATRSSPSSM
jgi:hypothetical protein